MGPAVERTGMCARGQPDSGQESGRPRQPVICEGTLRESAGRRIRDTSALKGPGASCWLDNWQAKGLGSKNFQGVELLVAWQIFNAYRALAL
jgi:hypothetical protein